MNDITILAKSSSQNPHKVYFGMGKGRLVIACDCQAGIHRQLCKHKIALAAGDDTTLHDPGQKADLARVHELIRKTKLVDLLTDINEAIKIEAQAKERVSKAKKVIGNAMNEGIDIKE